MEFAANCARCLRARNLGRKGAPRNIPGGVSGGPSRGLSRQRQYGPPRVRAIAWSSCALLLVAAGARHASSGPAAVELVAPRHASRWPAVVYDSPHSGRTYPSESEWRSAAPRLALRWGEDAYVDELLRGPATEAGVPLVLQNYPRCYIDVNRAPDDIDESLLAEPWPLGAKPTDKSQRGLGLIRRFVRPGVAIYDNETKLTSDELMARLQKAYHPYHGVLRATLDAALERHPTVWHVNWHSMKSRGNAMTPDGDARRPDFVISDVDGRSAGAEVTELVASFLRERGYSVSVNHPYHGGHIVKTYGRMNDPRVHSLQVEIKRDLYMDEALVEIKKDGFKRLQAHLGELTSLLVSKVPGGDDRSNGNSDNNGDGVTNTNTNPNSNSRSTLRSKH